MPSSGVWRRVYVVDWTDVSEDRIASIFRVEKSASEEPAWAGSCSSGGIRHRLHTGVNAFWVGVLCHDRQSVGQSVLEQSNQTGACDLVFITIRQLRIRWCRALSLTRWQACRLQLLLALASAVILGSESRGTRDHIYCLRFVFFSRIDESTAIYNVHAAGTEVTKSYSSFVLLLSRDYLC
jgi:hypothetical protein